MNLTRKFGLNAIKTTEHIVLALIAIATVIAIGQEIKHIFDAGRVELADLLLLFIYLEVLAMVSNFVESGKLPVRMPIYIAIVARTLPYSGYEGHGQLAHRCYCRSNPDSGRNGYCYSLGAHQVAL